MLEELTKSQKLMWMIEQYYKKTSINNIPGAGILMEQVDFEKLEESIKIVCNKYDNFRIRIKIEDGKPKQFLSDLSSLQIEKIDVKNIEELNEEMNKIAKTPIKSEKNLLFKFYIFKLANGQGAFMLNINHLISDGWTLGIICNEIIKIYSKLKRNQNIEKTTIYSYMDYIKHEKEYEKSEKFNKDRKYWEEVFHTLPENTIIPGSIKSSKEKNYSRADRKQFQLDKAQVIKIKEFCKENRISVYNFFMAVYGIYIGEISNLDEFVIGTPILNRTNYKEKNTAGLFINMLPFKININEKQEFKEYLRDIAINSMQMLKHQKYSYQYILEDLRKKDNNIPSLYNILLSYQITNAKNNGENVNYTTKWLFNGNCAEDIDIQIYDLDDTGNLDIAYDYRTSLYNDTDMEKMHNRIINIIEQILQNEDIKIQDIDIVTKEEKEKTVFEFNETKINYEKEETIINLFEQQVKRTPDKIAIISNGKKLTYKELNEKANILARKMLEVGTKPEDIVGIMIHRSPEMIIGLIAILKCGATYLPIDPEYPLDRIIYMLENSETKNLLVNNKTEKYVPDTVNAINIEKIEFDQYSDNENINLKINPQSLIYVIYTSGSTGKPKGVRITNQNLNNFINGMKQIIDFAQDKTMVSVTTVCFDIFGLEIWCTLTSGLSLVIANEEEQNTPSKLNKLCLDNNVNMIQTTPSRYSVIFEEKKNLEFAKNLTDILIGGESANNKIILKMKKETKARIFNMYGPTETTIWSTVKELTNERLITIGKPIANTQCYILNKNHKILPIGVPGELYIGGDGVSNGYLKREELNQEKFINNKFGIDGKLYNTNDLAYYLESGDIVHLGRTDFQVKIHGFRVELGEIENIIEKDKNVKQAIVVKKKLKTGHEALVAYYTAKESSKIEFKQELENKLPQYMIPQYFVKLEKMPYTQNGKIDRKSLPEPNLEREEKKIIQARNEIDVELIKIIEKMLQINNVSISDTLLELGGDSLTAITLSTKILSKFNVQINIKEILSNYTIKEISDYINENQFKENLKIKIEKTPKQDYYPLSSAQKRIYYNTKMIGEDNIVYNMPGAILVDEILEKEKVQKVFDRIIDRHSVLRTSFIVKENIGVVQKIDEKVKFRIEIYNNEENEIKKIVNNFTKSFDLGKAPLIRVEIHYIDNKKTLLLLDTHHIIMDGTSLNNLIIEFNRLYNGEDLKNIPIQYNDYSVWEDEYNKSNAIKIAENYWVNKFKNCEFSQLNLPYDYKMSVNKSYNGNRISNVINESQFRKIEKFAKKNGVSPYMLFISVFFILLYKYTGQTDINIGSPIANRNKNETKRMLGMFVNNIVIRGILNPEETFQKFLNNIKEQVLEDLSNQPYPFDMLIKKLGIKADNSKNPLFDVMFTYQNKEENIVKIDDKETEIIEINNNISKFNLSIEIKPKTHTINIEYCTDLFKENTIKRLFEHYMNIIYCIIKDINVKIKDVEIISKKEKNKILYEFNNTKMDYPKDKIISQLFEEQVKRTPNNIAVVFEKQKITYKELNEKANQLANYLRKNGIKNNDMIGVMLPRSIELIHTIIGIIKAGACYIPIDPEYPEQRIQYMLENSNAKLLITNNELFNNVEYESKLIADYTNIAIYSQDIQNLKPVNDAKDLAYVIYTSGSTGKPKGVKITNKNLCNFVIGIKDKIPFKEDKTMVSVTTICFDIFGLELWCTLTSGMKMVLANEEEQHMPSLLNKLCLENSVNMIQTTPSRYSLIFEEIENAEFFKNITDILVGGEAVTEKIVSKMKENSNARIFDVYGPTETTIWSTVKEITEENIISIGKPIANTQVYILDKEQKVNPIGIAGDLYIAGDGVGDGYLNMEELTKERYIKNPFLTDSIMYKTGDICKFSETGDLHYLGREDGQVKIRGLRIELEEIENKILEFSGIQKVKVIKQVIGNREIISAYFVANKRIKTKELREYLFKKLPPYMVPSYFTALDDFPYTPNGKIDKNMLPVPNGILQTEKKEYIKPRTDLEIKLVSIWEEVLNTKPIGIRDNFFELGGDSILAMNLNVKLLKITDRIKYADIFTYPTIEMLSERIKSDKKQKIEILDKLKYKYNDILKRNMLIPTEIKHNEIGNVLLTGVTGYLGIHILEELIRNETGRIYTLIRKEPGMTTRQKLLNKLHYYFGKTYDKYIDDRIFIIEGDMTTNGFGLQQQELLELGNDVNTIINSAAKVSHYGNYSEFYNTNVKSVEKLIDFCNLFNCKLFQISTLSISGNALVDQYYIEQKFIEDINFDEKEFYIEQDLENVYVKTKFEAEKKVLDAILNGTDAYILRMGNLMPRLSDGKFQQNIEENAYINRLKALMQMKCVPEYLVKGYLEFTPIDSSAEAILKIMQYTNSNNRIYHLFNHNHVTAKRFLETIKDLGVNIEIIDDEKFKQKLRNMIKKANSEILNILINDLDEDLNLHYESKVKLKSKHSVELLKKYGFVWPEIDEKYIENILNIVKGEINK